MSSNTEFRDRQYANAAKTVEEIESLLSLQLPIRQVLTTLQEIHTQLRTLGDPCTGKVHWRDPTSPKPKLMIIHRVGLSCPRHGHPKTRTSRIRTYIGTNSKRQATAIAAIVAIQIQRELEQDAHRCTRVIQHTLSSLQAIREQLDRLQGSLTS